SRWMRRGCVRTLLSMVCRSGQEYSASGHEILRQSLRMAYSTVAYLWSVRHTHPALHMVILRHCGSDGCMQARASGGR
ncbi:hypothetical protein, partial [uncultured Duncaniella sp.]|uniref:hypothetical protein n=1 Tax=uncultured Duncaniella sp. TaxID=2768039 RepID=UPI002648838A